MKFLQEFYHGFTQLTPGSNTGVYSNISDKLIIRGSRVDTASGYAGSCHVLEMGRHYSEYVRYRGEFPGFRRVPGFPHSHYLEPLDTKSRASNVTGNIGEIIAGIVAQRTLRLYSREIVHLKAKTTSKTPDYLLKRTPRLVQLLSEIDPTIFGGYLPEWWPMESKARGGGSLTTGVKEALRQLATYWYHIRYSGPQDVGYGIVVASYLKRPRRVCIYIFTPSDQNSLLGYLRGFSYESYQRDLKLNLSATGQYLH
jgi:hypothetical protein